MNKTAPTDATRYEKLVDAGLSSTQKQSIAWVPEGARVLELGCATGYIGDILMRQKGCKVVGVELDAKAAVEARGRGLDVRVGSLEDAAFRRSIAGPFDLVMATDVLEHLSDPDAVLADIDRWVAREGRVIVAVPNVAVWSMRVALLRGLFEYEETGLLDRTHLRFFTRDTLRRLVTAQGFVVEAEFVDRWEVPGLEHLMWSWPLRLRTSLAGRPPAWWRRALESGAGSLTGLHQRIGGGLGRVWPNLCGDHFALLLRPPPAAHERG
ncbi:MAG: class I SAM-dependent methyltransferase [Myxococcales bacterium]|nr:class I SAM-dependent methyltransferase [Myxococcales bacterium]